MTIPIHPTKPTLPTAQQSLEVKDRPELAALEQRAGLTGVHEHVRRGRTAAS